MTADKDEISHARVLKIAVPIVISNATVPILGLVDTGVVGQMGQAAPIGAVGIGAIIISSLYWFFGFLRMGTTGLAGQALGAGRQGEVVAILSRAVLAGAVGGVLIDSGVAAGRIRIDGRGEDAPIASNLTPQGRAQNRRVEIIIVPTR